MKLLKLIKSFFESKKKPSEENDVQRKKTNTRSPDFIDYDGMGNQGRFIPTRKKFKK